MNKEIILAKLNIQERSALFILSNEKLCKRIEEENIIPLAEFSKKYAIPLNYLQKLIKIGAISYFSNVKNKGSKNYIFEDEAREYLCKGIYHNGWGYRFIQSISLYLDIIEELLPEEEQNIIKSLLLNHDDIKSIATNKNVTTKTIYCIFQTVFRKLKLSQYIKQITKIREEHETLKWEIEFLKKQKEQYTTYLRKHYLTTTASTILKTSILDCEFFVRTVNCLLDKDINTVEQLLQYSRDDVKKFRNIGAKGVTEIDDFLCRNNLEWNTESFYMCNSK